MVPNHIREIRQEKGWSQTELARKTGISRQTINNLEHNRIEAPLSTTLRSIAQAFGCTVDSLFFAESA